jgi:hypothetical protein
VRESRFTSPRWFRLFACAGIVLAATVASLTADLKADDKDKEKPAAIIVPTRSPGNVFGDEESEFKFRVVTPRAVKGRVTWRLAEGTATIKTGEVDLNTNANAPADVSFKIAVPPVKDGVVLPTQLTLNVIEDNQTKPLASFAQDVWVFPKNAFADRSEWLKKLKITLYDPKGDTAKVLTAAMVPFEEARDVDAVAVVKEGVVIVGEGTSFKDERGLAGALLKLPIAGVVVLVLAPSSGEVLIPGVGGPAGGIEDMSFRREIVRKLDKRLDPNGWLPDGKVVASSVTVKMGEEAVGGEVAAGAGGWPWVEVRSDSGKGRWAFCGLGVIAKWDAGPTPRFLFVRMLEYLTDSETEKPN